MHCMGGHEYYNFGQVRHIHAILIANNDSRNNNHVLDIVYPASYKHRYGL